MASDTALTSALATNGLSVTVEAITVPQIATSPSPPPPSPSPPPPSLSASAVGICDVVNALPCFGSGGPCACSSTNNGAGLFGECTQIPPLGLGSVGVKVEIEPCDCDGPYAAVLYRVGTSAWEEAGSIKANADPLQFPVPGMTVSGIGGLFIHVTLTGTRGELTVSTELSLCAADNCNDDIVILGLRPAAAFPFSLFDIQQTTALSQFCDRAPACEGDSALLSPMMMAAAGGASVVIIGAIILYRTCCVKKRPPTSSTTQKKGFFLITPSSARPIVGVQGAFGYANSLPLHFPHPRPRSEIHRYPETTPLQGRCGCGSLLGSVPCWPSDDLPLRRRRLGWVSYYRALPPPAATARLSEHVRV